MRVSASEKLERIRLVEGSSLSVRRTLAEIGLPRSTFYAWYKRYLDGGPNVARKLAEHGKARRAWCTHFFGRIQEHCHARLNYVSKV